MNLEMEIEDLVLHGFPGMDKDRIARAVQMELERLITEGGVPASLQEGGDIARLEGGSFQVAPDLSAEEVGAQVARAIYGGMRR